MNQLLVVMATLFLTLSGVRCPIVVNSLEDIESPPDGTVTLRSALHTIEGYIHSGSPHQVCVANVWTTVLMQSDPELRRINNSASLVVADGGSTQTWSRR